MRLKSRGLGRKELVMDFREYEVVREGDEIVVVGTIRDPINWDFSIRMCEDDLPGLLHVISRRSTLWLVIRSLFKRSRKHHWSQPRSEHLAEGRRRRASAREKGEQRTRDATASHDSLGASGRSRAAAG